MHLYFSRWNSAFFWLLAVFISAIIWVVIPPLQGVHVVTVVLGALIQEAVRYGFIGVYARVEARVARLTPRGAPAALNDVSSAVGKCAFGAHALRSALTDRVVWTP